MKEKGSKIVKEFKEFALKGNVIDLAVGVIIGGAFGKVVTSLVNDVIMPPIGLLLGGVNFTDLYIALDGKHYESLQAAKDAGAATLNYGAFANTVLDFLIVSSTIFVFVKQLNRLRRLREKPEPEKEPATKQCQACYSDIPIKATRCKYCTSFVDQKGELTAN